VSDEFNHKHDDYDGIEEHDHPLPRWWVILFLATIIYSGLYILHYESKTGMNSDQELELGLSKLAELQKTDSTEAIDISSEVVKVEVIQLGVKLYAEKCFMCHGDKGQGLIGPNLTDSSWIYGKGTAEDILLVVQKGVPVKGMPAWESVLSAQEQVATVAYLLSIKGTNPSGAKAAEGILIK